MVSCWYNVNNQLNITSNRCNWAQGYSDIVNTWPTYLSHFNVPGSLDSKVFIGQPAGRKGKRIYLVSCYVVSSGPNGWPFANLLLGPSFLPHILVMIVYCVKGIQKKVQFAKCQTYPMVGSFKRLALVVPLQCGIHIFYWWKLQGLRSSAILRHQLWELRCHPTFRHVKVWLGKMDVVLSKRSFVFIKIQKTMITFLCFPTQGGMRTRVWEKWRVWIFYKNRRKSV